jgi:hypothetical protein
MKLMSPSFLMRSAMIWHPKTSDATPGIAVNSIDVPAGIPPPSISSSIGM